MFLDSINKRFLGAAWALGLAILLSASQAWSASRVDLNGEWQFRIDPRQKGEQLGWSKQQPDATETVRVPHTWNIGKYDDFEGTAWYFKKFLLPEASSGKHIEIHFGATFYISRIWLNGVEIGRHEGGHTEYFFDVSNNLKAVNFLAVELNNQPTAQTIPGWALKLRNGQNIWYDWWHYGGIVRDVWLNVNGAALVRRQQIRTKVEGASATVSDRVFLESYSRKPLPVKVALKAWAPDGKIAATSESSLTLANGKRDEALSMRIDSVKLWHFDLPNVYRMEVDMLDDQGNLLDSIADNFGARTIELHDRHLYVNGEPVRLTGMARHEESPVEGLAETPGTMLYDWNDMKALQMTLTRPVHYPQNPFILDYTDRNGILLIPEIPIWQFSEEQMSDPKVIALAKQMMAEMIEQDYNHPSLFAWSVCNESATNTPGGKAYFKLMYDFVKSLDPDRFVTYADDRIAFVDDPKQNSASLADFIMWNEYFGAWHGPTSMLPAIFDRIKRNYPDKMVVVSEFGTPGVFASNSKGADELRVRIIQEQMNMFGKQDWLGGALLWCYQDYKSHRNLWPGYTEGIVDHGLVDENRQRRPSYEVWKEVNSPARISLGWNYDSAGLPIGFHATIERRRPDEIPSYVLHQYQVVWEVRDDNGQRIAGDEKELPEIGPPQSLESTWQAPTSRALTLRITVLRPTGFVAAEKTLTWWEPRAGGLTVDEMKRRGAKVPD